MTLSATAIIRTVAQPTCPACGAGGEVAYAALRDRSSGVAGTWSVRACGTCGSGWLDPRPIPEDIGLCYPGDYYTHGAEAPPQVGLFAGPGAKNALRRLVLNGRFGYAMPAPGFAGARSLGWLLGALPAVRYRLAYRADNVILPWRRNGRLLDIGCGGGTYLEIARALGWQVHGIDPDPQAAAIAHQRTGAEVVVGTLEATSLPAQSFDAVVSMHAIEHAPDPAAFLQGALRLLKPGGVFYLQTPNFASLMRRRLAQDWFPLEVPRHLCILSLAALRRLLLDAAPWARLTVRALARRASVDQRLALAVRRGGRFDGPSHATAAERAQIAAWAAIDRAGNPFFAWGEEIEVLGELSSAPAAAKRAR